MCLEDGEQYAVVTRVLGGPNCSVVCQDGQTRMCVIRSKFRWRNKNQNRISPGSWIMVGVRHWETTASGTQKCDVLEVYSDTDASTLRQTTTQDLRALEIASHAAKPSGSAASGPSRAAPPEEVVFADEPQADEALIQSAKEEAYGHRPSTFGGGGGDGDQDEDAGEIDLDEI